MEEMRASESASSWRRSISAVQTASMGTWAASASWAWVQWLCRRRVLIRAWRRRLRPIVWQLMSATLVTSPVWGWRDRLEALRRRGIFEVLQDGGIVAFCVDHFEADAGDFDLEVEAVLLEGDLRVAGSEGLWG